MNQLLYNAAAGPTWEKEQLRLSFILIPAKNPSRREQGATHFDPTRGTYYAACSGCGNYAFPDEVYVGGTCVHCRDAW